MKKQKHLIRTLCIMLCTAVLCSLWIPLAGYAEETEVQENVIVDNSEYRLIITASGENKGEFEVKRKSDGFSWYSNPQDRFENEEDKGSSKYDAYSQLVFRLYDKPRGSEKSVNSYIGTERGNNIKIKKIDSGAEILYVFNDYKIAIPLQVILKDNRLTVSVNTEAIVEQGDYYVMEVSPIPYFGCGLPNEDGNLFVPDGSGAIINFNNNKAYSDPYSEKVYGDDYAFTKTTKPSNLQQIHLPVFGVTKPQGSVLGVIRNESANATVNAFSNGIYNSYNNVYATFSVRAKDKVVIGGKSQSSMDFYKYVLDKKASSMCLTEYQFLNEKSGYTEMAHQYKQYLLENGLQKNENISATPELMLDIYGGIKKRGDFLGIPIDIFYKLTNVKQLCQILDELSDEGIGRPLAVYRNSDSALIDGKMQNKLRLKSSLGSLEALKEKGVFLEYNPFSAKKSGNSYSKIFDISKKISEDPIVKYDYMLSTFAINYKSSPVYLPNMSFLKKNTAKIKKSADKNKLNIAFTGAADTVYADYNQDRFKTREQNKNELVEIFSTVQNDIVYNPNEYAIYHAKYLNDLPAEGSKFDICDRSVPFYQIAVSGLREYSVTSVNLSSDAEKQFLKAVETASSLKFSLVYQNIDKLKNTDYDYLYAADYSSWKSEIADMQKQMNEIYNEIGNRQIVQHFEISPNVYETIFQNGNGVIVNYSSSPVDTADGNVPPMGYKTVIKEG